MALQNGPGRDTPEQLDKRFGIAQDRKPVSPEQLQVQAEIRGLTAQLASYINENVGDGREKSLSFTHLEDALMWAGKAIFA